MAVMLLCLLFAATLGGKGGSQEGSQEHKAISMPRYFHAQL